MKYIITAKETAEGTSKSDIANPLKVTEIATELVITRLACIMLLKDDKINKDDTIVTNGDRLCLYENIFARTMSWNDFKKAKLSKKFLDPNLILAQASMKKYK